MDRVCIPYRSELQYLVNNLHCDRCMYDSLRHVTLTSQVRAYTVQKALKDDQDMRHMGRLARMTHGAAGYSILSQ